MNTSRAARLQQSALQRPALVRLWFGVAIALAWLGTLGQALVR